MKRYNFSRVIKISVIFLLLGLTFLLSVKQGGGFKSVDEVQIGQWVWRLYEAPFPVIQYSPLMLYLHFLLSLLYQAVLLFLGYISSGLAFVRGPGMDLTIELGRYWSALFGTLAVFMAYKTGKDFYGQGVGLLAGLVMAFNPLLVLYSHIFKPDILTALLLSVSLYFMLHFLKNGQPGGMFKSALFFGLAVAAKYNALPLILVLALALFFKRKELDRKGWQRAGIYLPLGAMVGFFLGAPNWLVHPVQNFRLMFQTYNTQNGALYAQFDKLSFGQVLGHFFTDLVHYFGVFWLVVLVLGMIYGLITRDKKDMLLSTFILLYIFVFGFTHYYGSRFILPLYAAIVVLIAKTLFVDLKRLLLPRTRGWGIIALAIWGITAIYAADQAFFNIRTFNLLKTGSKKEWLKDYRKNHFIMTKKITLAAQFMTPHISKDLSVNRDLSVLRESRAKGREGEIAFLQLGWPTYRSLLEHGLTGTPVIDLAHFRPFYRVEKPDSQILDEDFILLYRVSPQLSGITPGALSFPLPRIFYRGQTTTYLPLQVYEKNPLFGQTEAGTYSHWLYSKKALAALKIYYLSPGKTAFYITSNGQKKAVSPDRENRVAELLLTPLTPKKLSHDFVYRVDIATTGGKREHPLYFVFCPVYRDEEAAATPGLKFTGPFDGEIPALFAPGAFPAWVKDFYGKTGTDLSLLDFVNREIIYNNFDRQSKDATTDILPLQRGHYLVEVSGQTLFTGAPAGPGVLIHLLGYGKKPFSRKQAMNGQLAASLEISVTEPVCFFQIKVTGTRANNYLVERITLRPHYPQSLVNPL